jgi:hypothetical protein
MMMNLALYPISQRFLENATIENGNQLRLGEKLLEDIFWKNIVWQVLSRGKATWRKENTNFKSEGNDEPIRSELVKSGASYSDTSCSQRIGSGRRRIRKACKLIVANEWSVICNLNSCVWSEKIHGWWRLLIPNEESDWLNSRKLLAKRKAPLGIKRWCFCF